MVAAAREADARSSGPARHQALKQALTDLARTELTRHGVPDPDAGLSSLAIDLELNAQGLAVWLDRQKG
jgi:hypothetical protein